MKGPTLYKYKFRQDITDCIGNTPLIRMARLFPESTAQVFGKLEMFNPGGSIKDRTAMNILQNAIDQNLMDAKTTVIESTSGNMGVGLTMICHFMGLKLILVTDPHLNESTEKILTVFGADIIKVEEHDGKGGYLNTRLEKVTRLLDEIPNSFWPDQYHNFDNPGTHEQTYLEIVEELGTAPDYIFIATSTCGTLRGFGDAIKKHHFRTKLIAVDSVGSVIFGDRPNPRLIPGMGSSRRSDFLLMDQVEDVVLVSDKDAVAGCHDLLAAESILAGGSSGAVVKAMERKLPEIPADVVAVGVFADTGERYLNTIFSKEWVSGNFTKE